jgi:hypothetical protein
MSVVGETAPRERNMFVALPDVSLFFILFFDSNLAFQLPLISYQSSLGSPPSESSLAPIGYLAAPSCRNWEL